MEIRDPVHGSIQIHDEEIPILSHNFFQRLRNIKQLGFSEYVFPGATHTRLLHSIGVMHIGTKAFDKLFFSKLHRPETFRIKETFKLACLLHDVGHAPLSHATESVMPKLSELKVPDRFLSPRDKLKDRQAGHEDYTIKSIVDSSFTQAFDQVKTHFGVDPNCIADIIVGHTQDDDYFTIDGINYFPILHQLVSSELDCDRMDYLLRDSYFCGVSYGNYDLDWLIDNIQYCVIDKKAYLAMNERAVVTFDDFLLSRFHMFLMVYFHYRSVCLEQLLLKFFKTASEEYSIPANIEDYLHHDDHYLMKVLRNSKNSYAQAIVNNRIPQKIFESFNEDQLKNLERVEDFLKQNDLEYIRCSSSGRLSKYYTDDAESKPYSIKVLRGIIGKEGFDYFNIDKATDLFHKFSKVHAVNRLHCHLDEFAPHLRHRLMELIHGRE